MLANTVYFRRKFYAVESFAMNLQKTAKKGFFASAATWAYKNKFASFLVTLTLAYFATFPFHTPEVSTSYERSSRTSQEWGDLEMYC